MAASRATESVRIEAHFRGNMKKCFLMAACVLVILVAVNAIGQQSPPSAPAKGGNPAERQKEHEDVVKISVTLVQVDAVVTDDKGRYVSNLKPDDFELFED